MFDDLDTTESNAGKRQESSQDKEKFSWWIGGWAPFIAIVVFALAYFPLENRFWSWQFAVTLSYVTLVLCRACGLAFRDSDDLFGNLRVPEFMGKLLIRQILVLALVSFGAYFWRFLKPSLPEWITHEYHRGSYWDLCGLFLASLVAVKEASWMAARIKRKFPELEDPA